jgi:hypothetical protein
MDDVDDAARVELNRRTLEGPLDARLACARVVAEPFGEVLGRIESDDAKVRREALVVLDAIDEEPPRAVREGGHVAPEAPLAAIVAAVGQLLLEVEAICLERALRDECPYDVERPAFTRLWDHAAYDAGEERGPQVRRRGRRARRAAFVIIDG